MGKSFADVMKSEKNGRRRITEQVCFSATVAEEYQALALEFAEAKRVEDSRQARTDPDKPTGRRLVTKPKSVEILERMAELVGANSESFYDVEFEQMERGEWLLLRAAHPPRDKVDDDKGLFNSETFPIPAIAASLVDPEPTDDVIEYFRSTLSNGETERLARLIWNLNEGVRSVPKGAAESISLLLGGSATD